MKRRVLIVGLGVFIFAFLSVSLTRPAYAQTCSAENIDPGESTRIDYTVTSHPREQLVVRIECPRGETCPGFQNPGIGNDFKNFCSEFGKTSDYGYASGVVGPFSIKGLYTVLVQQNRGGCGLIGPLETYCRTSFVVGKGIKYDICQGDTTGKCEPCVAASNAWTAIGCITTSDTQEFTIWLLKTGIGIAGGIALLLMIMGGILIILSSGDPQKLQSGKDILTSAILGLVVIIFSVFLLQLIGVQILMIPGFR